MNNPWRDCEKDPPMQYKRVEIKNRKNVRYCGYRYKNKYYESFGNYIIPEPYMWRFIKDKSFMAEWIKDKINSLRSREGANTEYAYHIFSNIKRRFLRRFDRDSDESFCEQGQGGDL